MKPKLEDTPIETAESLPHEPVYTYEKTTKETSKCVCGEQECLGGAEVELGGVCHRPDNPCFIITKTTKEQVEEFYKEFGHLAVVKNEISGNQYKSIGQWLPTALKEAEERGRREGYQSMMSRIDSHGFFGLMTGEYELKRKEDHE